MGIASGFKKLAGKSFNKLGGNVTIRKVTNGTYDTSSGEVSESNTDVVVKAIIENVNNNEVNNLIQAQDKKVTVAASDLTFVPSPRDKVLINSVVFNIVSVLTNEQANTAITFELFVRS